MHQPSGDQHRSSVGQDPGQSRPHLPNRPPEAGFDALGSRADLKVSAEGRARASGRVGVVALVTVAAGNVALWALARPRGQPFARFLGELCGAEAVLLFSCALVLATLLRRIERAFDGLDRVALWHRRAAVAGVLLLIPHVALVTSGPDRYATPPGPGLGD
jgi:hypothetical protein